MLLFTRKSSHPIIKPGLLVATMFVSNGFVLGTDLIQDFVEVLMGCSINLHVDCASKLRAQCLQLLNNRGEKELSIKTIGRVSEFYSCIEAGSRCSKH